MATLKVTQIGNSLGVILPREVAARLKVEKGDEVAYVETPGGIDGPVGTCCTVTGLDPGVATGAAMRDSPSNSRARLR